MEKNTKISLTVIGACLLIMVALSFLYIPMWKDDIILPGPGVTEVKWLSDYVPELKGTLGDTRVFILDSGVPGGNALILGGTHSDEPGAWIAAMILVERAKVSEGKLIVIPQANNSGFTHNYPMEAHPSALHIPLPDGGIRVFRHGGRTANSAEHWPDPEVFIHYPTRQKLSGEEVRNLNRAYPGRKDGTFVQLIAYGIRTLVAEENIHLQLDLHEAQPEYPFVNAVSAHPHGSDIASFAQLYMQEEGLDIGVEMSPDSFRGLSNREMGDFYPELFAFITESTNIEQGKVRGITDEALAMDGRDAFYVATNSVATLKTVPVPESGLPLKLRAGRNLTSLRMLLQALDDMEGKRVVLENIPTYAELMRNDIGFYLNPLPPEGVPAPGYRALPGIWRLITRGG
jgi:predicted deacylase